MHGGVHVPRLAHGGLRLAARLHPQAEGEREADQGVRARGRAAHRRVRVHDDVPGPGGGVLHAHHQGCGALLLRRAQLPRARQARLAADAALPGPHRAGRQRRVHDGALVQLAGLRHRDPRQPGGDSAQRVQQDDAGRRARAAGLHEPLHHHHHHLGGHPRALRPAAGGRALPAGGAADAQRRLRGVGAGQAGARGRVAADLPADVVRDLEPRVPGHALGGQLREARGGHRGHRDLLPQPDQPGQRYSHRRRPLRRVRLQPGEAPRDAGAQEGEEGGAGGAGGGGEPVCCRGCWGDQRRGAVRLRARAVQQHRRQLG
mmetsp:Transcript_1234/g.4099  ORF Transcript_1234/g.4099 Transcript_1234/m.4099 type:complete len:317 (+) Transcript_1234:367-1317(+)